MDYLSSIHRRVRANNLDTECPKFSEDIFTPKMLFFGKWLSIIIDRLRY